MNRIRAIPGGPVDIFDTGQQTGLRILVLSGRRREEMGRETSI